MGGLVVIHIPSDITARLGREASRQGLSLEEYLLEIALRDLDPPKRAKEYVEASESLLEQAEDELQKGDVMRAAEKLWGAVALAVKAYAAWRHGRGLASHGELWEYVAVLEKELGEWVHDAWASASEMHVCFYEGWCKAFHVRAALRRIEKLVKAVKESLSTHK